MAYEEKLTGLFNQDPTNLKIYDSEYLDYSSSYKKIGKDLNNVIKKYLKTLDKLSNSLDGKFAANMKEYKEKVNFLIGDAINGGLQSLCSNMNEYIEEIDKKDGKLYQR